MLGGITYSTCLHDMFRASPTSLNMAEAPSLPLPFPSLLLSSPPQAVDIEVPNIPNDASKGVHKVPFDRVMYIDQSDFREVSAVSMGTTVDHKCSGWQHGGWVTVCHVCVAACGWTLCIQCLYVSVCETVCVMSAGYPLRLQTSGPWTAGWAETCRVFN